LEYYGYGMEHSPEIPHELFAGCETEEERAARLGRFLVLQECGFFGKDTNLNLALAQGKGSWTAQVRRRFSGIYGDVRGCDPADLEIAAEMLGVFPDIYNIEALQDDAA
jgi:hypothetical protein